ncbi:RNA polymerase sigma-70 factor, sigma-B/F/G subfamily [Halobacteroides halobius DSM 5150]|uniref:RNA polymerase sigma factor n=1 Tax=Halobacteroides halobius (strain ATCC 35273 / DSM 5150 / MD-1) TaxID=748449 RepID=L0K9D3_HALHC|nr:RNA polymerase sporulation sigma factor SigG [Halobacteroides halobius]AGB41626.1 RNA polymerase sigma-70 factor, sigma-B/F/G subfamily [Halobacteroides halobius DSM 5150]
MGKKVEISGVNTSELPVLSNKEMRKLFKKMQTRGSDFARSKIIGGNLRLVLSVLQRFNNRGEPIDDLFQVGCVGLIKAIDNFDLSKNVKFSTYAVPMIIGEIKRHLRDNNPIRVSRSLRDTAYKALQMKETLENNKTKDPNLTEIAKELGIPRSDIVRALDAIQDPISLFEPVYHDGGDPIYVMDQVRDDEDDDHDWLEAIAVREALRKLDDREKLILTLRFYEGKTQMEVAGTIGISQAQVSRLEKAALQDLKKHVREKE